MKQDLIKITSFLLTVYSLNFCEIQALQISPEQAKLLASKIWRNECREKAEGLTSWNAGEEFASLGIGHFIWYPPHQHKVFKETFPDLIAYLKEHNISLPHWLEASKSCPWPSKQAFDKDLQSPRMLELRNLLLETQSLQAYFIARRLETALPEIVKTLDDKQKNYVVKQFHRLTLSPAGIYALLDYLNFKGEGISPAERYSGKGWGLLQVLEEMPDSDSVVLAIEQFVQTAKKILERRVSLAPVDRHEERWLKGWHNRLDTYFLE